MPINLTAAEAKEIVLKHYSKAFVTARSCEDLKGNPLDRRLYGIDLPSGKSLSSSLYDSEDEAWVDTAMCIIGATPGYALTRAVPVDPLLPPQGWVPKIEEFVRHLHGQQTTVDGRVVYLMDEQDMTILERLLVGGK